MAGDLPNIVAGPDGTALAEIMSPYLHLNMDTEDTLFDADGSSLVLFEKADDYQSDPEGERSGSSVIAVGRRSTHEEVTVRHAASLRDLRR